MAVLLDYGISFGGDLLVLGFVALCAYQGKLRRYIWFNVYLTLMLTSSVARQSVLHAYGFRSTEYFYTYYVSDFFVICSQCLVLLHVLEGALSGLNWRISRRSMAIAQIGLASAHCPAFFFRASRTSTSTCR